MDEKNKKEKTFEELTQEFDNLYIWPIRWKVLEIAKWFLIKLLPKDKPQ